MSILLNALESGLPLSIGFLGVWLVLRTQNDFDLTVEASFTLGAAVSTRMLLHSVDPWLAVVFAGLVGSLAGVVTYVIKRLLGLTLVLASIIVSIGLYSVNLKIMGTPNVATPNGGITTMWAHWMGRPEGQRTNVVLFALVTAVVVAVLSYGLSTERGLALRASGRDPQMARLQGVSTEAMLLLSLVIGNGLVGMSGAIVSQQQGFVDVNMGVGTLVFAVTAVLLGETIVRRSRPIAVAVVGVVVGTLAYRAILAYALSIGVDPGLFKGITAVIVIGAVAINRALTASGHAIRNMRHVRSLQTSAAHQTTKANQ